MSVFKAFQPIIFTFFSFPLHSGRGLGGDVVADAVDVLHLAYDAVGHLVQQLIGQAGPCGGHEILGLHGTQGQRIVVGTLVAHDAHAAQVGQHGKELAGGAVKARQLHLLAEDGVGIPQDGQLLLGDIADHTDGQAGAREGLTPHQLVGQAQLGAQLGTELGLPDELVWRQPFPGPGLAIRVIGDITEEKLAILRDADAIFREEMKLAGLDRTTSQFFAVLTDLRSVGVMGDERTYDYTLALRAVQSQDFMTATWSRLPYELLDKVSNRIVGEVKHINRICYDITSKPPATVEWE